MTPRLEVIGSQNNGYSVALKIVQPVEHNRCQRTLKHSISVRCTCDSNWTNIDANVIEAGVGEDIRVNVPIEMLGQRVEFKIQARIGESSVILGEDTSEFQLPQCGEFWFGLLHCLNDLNLNLVWINNDHNCRGKRWNIYSSVLI